MVEFAGGGAEDYYKRYQPDELFQMAFADSPEDAANNQLQWYRLGKLLAGASEAVTKVAKDLPDSYQSQQGAPALLQRIGETAMTMQNYAEVADRNAHAWGAVNKTLKDTQGIVAASYRFGGAGLGEAAHDAMADAVDRMSTAYISHANEILPPELDDTRDPGDDTGGGEQYVTDDVYGGGSGLLPPGQRGPGAGTPPPTAPGKPGVGTPPPAAPGKPGVGMPPGGARGGTPGLIGAPGGGSERGYSPIGRTLGGGRGPGTGLPAGSGFGANADASARSLGRLGGPGGPGGPPTPPGTRGGKDNRRRRRKRRGGLLGDPDDFRFDPEVVAPPELHPDDERPVVNMGKTIGGKQVSADAQQPGADAPTAKSGKQAPSASPFPDGDIELEGTDGPFKLRRRGGA